MITIIKYIYNFTQLTFLTQNPILRDKRKRIKKAICFLNIQINVLLQIIIDFKKSQKFKNIDLLCKINRS